MTGEGISEPRKGLVVALFAVGALVATAPVLYPPARDWADGTLANILMEVGVALALAGVLVLLERVIEGRLLRKATESIDEVRGEVKEGFEEVASRISQLGNVDAAVEAAEADQRQKINEGLASLKQEIRVEPLIDGLGGWCAIGVVAGGLLVGRH